MSPMEVILRLFCLLLCKLLYLHSLVCKSDRVKERKCIPVLPFGGAHEKKKAPPLSAKTRNSYCHLQDRSLWIEWTNGAGGVCLHHRVRLKSKKTRKCVCALAPGNVPSEPSCFFSFLFKSVSPVIFVVVFDFWPFLVCFYSVSKELLWNGICEGNKFLFLCLVSLAPVTCCKL